MSISLTLRPAESPDRRLLWEWRNAPDVRATAFDPDPVPWSEHEKWFARKAEDPRCLLFIAEDGESPIGQVRLDLEEDGAEAEISVSLDGTQRGRGLGSALIRAGVRAAAAEGLRAVHAYIKYGNTASIRAFERAGFASAGVAEVRGTHALHYLWQRDDSMSTIRPLTIGERQVGPGHSAYIIAEMSANHDHDLEKALRIVEAAAEAGADAVKLQTYTPDTMTIQSDKEPFRIKGTLWEGRTLYDLYAEAYTPWEWHEPIQARAHDLGLDFLSTPFDGTAVDFLERLDVPVYKIASFEIVDLPLLRRVAATGKPVIMSTGMASFAEVEEAVQTLRGAGCKELALLKCTSAYPAPPEEANLRTIPHLRETFDVVPGLSDHTMSESVPVAAVALGACLVEKHFTLSRADPGPDSGFSLEPQEFRRMVEAVRTTEMALGKTSYGVTEKQQVSTAFRRSLFVVKDVRVGEAFTAENIRSIRPDGGLHTRHLNAVLGQKAACAIERGTPLQWDHVDRH